MQTSNPVYNATVPTTRQELLALEGVGVKVQTSQQEGAQHWGAAGQLELYLSLKASTIFEIEILSNCTFCFALCLGSTNFANVGIKESNQ